MITNPYARQWAQFKGETANHGLTVLHSDGLYRHLRMSAPGTGIWHWDVITWPGHLAIDGDIGLGLIFSRDIDMIEFFAAGLRHATYDDGAPQISIGYWAEKLSRGAESVKKYSPDLFMEYVRTTLDEGATRASERAELLASAEAASECEQDAREWLQEERRAVGDDAYWEWGLKDWDHHFLLACYAIATTVRAVS